MIVPSEESLLSTDDWRYGRLPGYAGCGQQRSAFTTSASDKFTLTPMSRYEFGGTVTLKRLSADFRIEDVGRRTREGPLHRRPLAGYILLQARFGDYCFGYKIMSA